MTADRPVADFYEAAVSVYGGKPKIISNWISGELFRLIKDGGTDLDSLQVSPAGVAELATLVDKGDINNKTAREVLREMVHSGESAATIVERRGLVQISDQGALEGIVNRVLSDHPEQVASYLAGKESLIQWLMGQVMRETRGKANPGMVKALLAERLDSMRKQG